MSIIERFVKMIFVKAVSITLSGGVFYLCDICRTGYKMSNGMTIIDVYLFFSMNEMAVINIVDKDVVLYKSMILESIQQCYLSPVLMNDI